MHVCLQITIIMKHNQTENIEKIFTEICKDLEFQTFNIFKNFGIPLLTQISQRSH